MIIPLSCLVEWNVCYLSSRADLCLRGSQEQKLASLDREIKNLPDLYKSAPNDLLKLKLFQNKIKKNVMLISSW